MKFWPHITIVVLMAGLAGAAFAQPKMLSPAPQVSGGAQISQPLPIPVLPSSVKAEINKQANECTSKGGAWGVHEKGNITRCKMPGEDQLKKECLAKGGRFDGIYPSPCKRKIKDLCSAPTSDGGKTCDDKSDCEGECLWKEEIKGGQCAEFIGSPYGNTMNNGQHSPFGCL